MQNKVAKYCSDIHKPVGLQKVSSSCVPVRAEQLPRSFRREAADPVNDAAEHHRLHKGVRQAQQGSGQGGCPGLQHNIDLLDTLS